MTVATKSGEDGLPGSLSQVGTIIRYTFRNYFRARRFLVLLIIALLVMGLLTVVTAYYRSTILPSTALDFYSFWWGLVGNLMIVFSGIFFGADAISSEFQDRTGYFLIPNPVRRSTVYAGKLISAFLASAIILAIVATLTLANGFYYFGFDLPIQLGQSLGLALIYLAAVLGFAFLFSSFFKSSAYAIIVTLVLLILGFNLIDTISTNLAHIEPWFSLTYGGAIVGNILTVPYPPHYAAVNVPRDAGFSLSAYTATVPEGVIIIIAYFLVTAILGLMLFERKEFN